METFVHDLRHAMRLMRRDPAFTLTALATLVLGIGLSTAIFSVAYGALWRPLPYPDPDRLVAVASAQQTGEGIRTFSTWAPVTFDVLRDRATTLDHLAAYTSANSFLTGRGDPQQVPALSVSPNFFATLGVTPALGRQFLTGAEAPDDDRSAIISDRLWRSVFHADPAIIGEPIGIDGVPHTIVGVLDSDFSFAPAVPNFGGMPSADVFLPNRWPGDTGQRASLWLIGRMKAGVTEARAEAELTELANAPGVVPVGTLASAGAVAADGRMLARVTNLQEYGTDSARLLLLILLGAVTFVLLIACVNVANLQMARLTARRGELSIRMALGAGRRRIVRQLLTEAVVLSLAGAVLGAALAHVAVTLTLPLVPQAMLPRIGSIAIDGRVMLFCLGLSALATLVIGLAPALRVSGASFGEARAQHGGEVRTTGDRQGERVRTLLVSAQIAMTLVLLVGAGLLVHSFIRLASASPGFDPGGQDGVVQTVRVTLPEYLYDSPESIHAFARTALERVQHLPGINSASLINSLPFGLFFIQDEFEVDGLPKPSFFAGTPKVEPGYFETLGIPLLAGRDFSTSDTASAPLVAIVSERVVSEFFPDGPGAAIGHRLKLGEGDQWLSIVGVVADVRQFGLDVDVKPMIYVPFEQDQSGFLRILSFVARTTDPARAAQGIRSEIRSVAPAVPIESAPTMDEAMAAAVAQPRFRMVLLGLFSIAALLIATCGLYGVMAYAVTQRRREIGVRMACGATRSDVLRLILTNALRIVLVGLVAGMLGAFVVTRVLRTLLFGIEPTDPIVLTSVTVLLLLVGLAAAWMPAHRATRIDPWRVLRAE